MARLFRIKNPWNSLKSLEPNCIVSLDWACSDHIYWFGPAEFHLIPTRNKCFSLNLFGLRCCCYINCGGCFGQPRKRLLWNSDWITPASLAEVFWVGRSCWKINDNTSELNARLRIFQSALVHLETPTKGHFYDLLNKQKCAICKQCATLKKAGFPPCCSHILLVYF